MFIQTEKTPNPQTIKFLPHLPSKESWASGEWTSAQAAKEHPLAALLFALPGVARVFLGDGWIAITKDEQWAWEQIKADILGALMDFFSQGGASRLTQVATGNTDKFATKKDGVAETEEEIKIKEIIATHIQPAVAQDGGDIQLERFEGGVAYLAMRGACAGCPSSLHTLKNGVENLLRYYVPEVERVEATEVFV